MDIYVVQKGDTVEAIAMKYGISVNEILINNGLENPYVLIPGQTIVIVYPTQTHTVQAGDTIKSIASNYNVSIMQLIRNNPFLYNREFIYPGESIVISYNAIRDLMVIGYTYPYINIDVLKKSLPYLTFLSIFNYRVIDQGMIQTYSDDLEIIQIAKAYGTVPLLMISALSPLGEANLEIVFEFLANEEFQDNMIDNVISIMQQKGYQGINIVISRLNLSTENLYLTFITKVSKRFEDEGYLLYLTINPNIKEDGDNIIFEKISYHNFEQLVNRIVFLQYYWGIHTEPPAPVSSVKRIRPFLNYVTSVMNPDKNSIGKPLVAYDWTLPYDPNVTTVHAMTHAMSLNSAITLARDSGSQIQFDEPSQTPFFYYYQSFVGESVDHIVWFVDARSIKSIYDLILEYDLTGTSIWNIMTYYQHLWTITNSQFNVIKLIPDNL